MSSTVIRRPQWSSVCSNCRAQSRSFSNGPIRAAAGPESPRYITIPEPPQLPRKALKPVKGVLPVPKKIFTNRFEGDDGYVSSQKVADHIDKVAPEPLNARPDAHGPGADLVAYNRRLSNLRRENLRTGLEELKERKNRNRAMLNRRSQTRRRDRLALINAPARDDEKYTNPSVTAEVRALLSSTEFAGRTPEALEKSRKRYAAQQERKQHIRQAHLHTLYTHAREFILTSDQLNTAIDTAFGTDEDPVVWNLEAGSDADPAVLSIWNLGAPEDMTQMLARQVGGKKVVKGIDGIEVERLKKIAGEVTGGKFA